MDGERARLVRVALVDVVGAVLAAAVLVLVLLPLRPSDPEPPFSVGVALACLWYLVPMLAGAVVGLVQSVGARHNLAAPIVLGTLCALPPWALAWAAGQSSRLMPVPDGGEPFDPSVGEVTGIVLGWLLFAAGAAATLLVVLRRVTADRCPG